MQRPIKSCSFGLLQRRKLKDDSVSHRAKALNRRNAFVLFGSATRDSLLLPMESRIILPISVPAKPQALRMQSPFRAPHMYILLVEMIGPHL